MCTPKVDMYISYPEIFVGLAASILLLRNAFRQTILPAPVGGAPERWTGRGAPIL